MSYPWGIGMLLLVAMLCNVASAEDWLTSRTIALPSEFLVTAEPSPEELNEYNSLADQWTLARKVEELVKVREKFRQMANLHRAKHTGTRALFNVAQLDERLSDQVEEEATLEQLYLESRTRIEAARARGQEADYYDLTYGGLAIERIIPKLLARGEVEEAYALADEFHNNFKNSLSADSLIATLYHKSSDVKFQRKVVEFFDYYSKTYEGKTKEEQYVLIAQSHVLLVWHKAESLETAKDFMRRAKEICRKESSQQFIASFENDLAAFESSYIGQ